MVERAYRRQEPLVFLLFRYLDGQFIYIGFSFDGIPIACTLRIVEQCVGESILPSTRRQRERANIRHSI